MIKYSLILFLLVTQLIQGCAAVRPFPMAARSGDTITLAVGSLDGANNNNLTIGFYSDSDPSTAIDITSRIRSVFNIFPDKTSDTYLKPTNSFLETDFVSFMSGHSPWMTVVAIDLPGILPIGPGHIKVVTGPDVIQPFGAYKVDNINIALEILPGEGNPNSFGFMEHIYSLHPRDGNLNSFQSRKQILVRGASGLANYYENANTVCAAEFIINGPVIKITDPTSTVPDSATIVIHDSTKSDIPAKTQMSWIREGDNMKVMFISPTCELRDRMIRFSLLPDIYSGFDFTGAPSLESSRYFNETGAEIAGYAPQLVLVNF